MTEPILSARGLSKHYGSVQALSDVSFSLQSGEVMALLGENGAGKSTFVKVLAGLVNPDSGVIEMAGEPVGLYPSSRSQAAGIAVVHQEYCSVPTMSIAENLVLGQREAPRLWIPRRMSQASRPYLEAVGLRGIDPRTLVSDLTVAEVQLLEIARLLVRNARVLILDEPTAALSDHEIDRVESVVRTLRDEGRTVIYVTHRLAEVFRIADRVTVFRNGESLDPVEVENLDIDAVITMMLGRRMQAMFPDRAERNVGDVVLRVSGLEAPGLSAPIDFEVRAGEIVGLTGQLGSGAETVLRTLAGTTGASAGTIGFAGEAVNLAKLAHLRGGGVAYCSPDRKRDGIFAGRSMRENLSAPWLHRVARLGWVQRPEERARASSIGRRFAVDVGRLNSDVATLSGGNQQKVAVGRWLGTEPQVMLLAEPTRGVDVGARAEIYECLQEVAKNGVAVVIASSDTSEVLGLADAIGTFYRGRLTAFDRRENWNEERLAREVMHPKAESAA